MNIARVIMSVGKSAIALSPFAIISIWFILTLFSGPSAEGKITDFFISVTATAELEQQGVVFSDIAKDVFVMAAWINIWSLAIVTIFALGWSAGSHYLNVDAPGKAKIYFIHCSLYIQVIDMKLSTLVVTTKFLKFPLLLFP